jgi:hypothetical protein
MKPRKKKHNLPRKQRAKRLWKKRYGRKQPRKQRP